MSENSNLNLKKLDFHSIKINSINALALAKFLQVNKTLQELDFAHCELGSAVTKEIVDALASNPGTLQTLDLTYNHIGIEGSEAIARLLKNNAASLNFLSLSANHNMEDRIPMVCDALKNNKTLRILFMSFLFLEKDISARSIAEMIAENEYLETLLLSKSVFIKDDHGALIVGALKSNKMLKKIDLSVMHDDSDFSEKTARALGNMLEHNTTLKNLDISGHKKLGNAAERIAPGLNKNHTLHELDLGYTSIKDDGLVKLLNAIESSKSLTSLNVKCCKISEQSTTEIAMLLENNAAPLKYLDITSKDFSEEDHIKIFDSLKKNTYLTTLHIGNNSHCTAVSEKASFHLLDTLKYYNCTLTYVSNYAGDSAQIYSLLKRNKQLSSNELDINELKKIMDEIRKARLIREPKLPNQPYPLRFSLSCSYVNKILDPAIKEDIKRDIHQMDIPSITKSFLR